MPPKKPEVQLSPMKPLSEMNEAEVREFAVRSLRVMEEIADIAICACEGAAHRIRRIVGYVDGPYPDLKHKDD